MALVVGGYEALFTAPEKYDFFGLENSISLYNKGHKCILHFIKPVTKVSVTRLSSVLLYLIDMRVSVIS